MSIPPPKDAAEHYMRAMSMAASGLYNELRTIERDLKQAQDDHHKLGAWPKCPHCVRFFQQDENGAAENARLRSDDWLRAALEQIELEMPEWEPGWPGVERALEILRKYRDGK